MKMLTPALFLRGVTPGKNTPTPHRCGAVDRPATSRINFFETPARPPEPEAGPTDVTWVARVQAGDEAAARQLMERLLPTILKSVRRHLPRRTSEEDLVQTILIKVFTKLGQFSGTVPLEHWVSRISVNTCLSQIQHEMVRPELRMSDLSEEEEAVIQQLAFTHDALPTDQSHCTREVMGKILARLTADERRVITLLHLEERSTKEISRLTGWSVSGVKVKAFRARQKMRQLWQTLPVAQESLVGLMVRRPVQARKPVQAAQTAPIARRSPTRKTAKVLVIEDYAAAA